jgi:hypothetical protein
MSASGSTSATSHDVRSESAMRRQTEISAREQNKAPMGVVWKMSAMLDQEGRRVGWSDPSSNENSTRIVSFVPTLPFKSLSATRSF